jgi:RHS repeat-associated protein
LTDRNYLLGVADPAAAVTINGQPATRLGEWFHRAAAVDNATAPAWAQLSVRGVLAGAGHNGSDAVDEKTGHRFLAEDPEVFTHDADGNLLSDGRWAYTWDAENRLVQMESMPAAVTAGAPKQMLEFAYDSQSRRFRKTVWRDYGSGWELQNDRLFLYDGWNLLLELDGANTVISSYTWGLDLSETLQGAGGVGGLLAMSTATGVYIPAYDGNGNVVGMFDSATETLVGEYEYSPFGETIRSTGVSATFGFSTKYTDAETGLLYYGYRYYSPEAGRWLSRDPIGEGGGIGLYGFVGNNPISFVDLLGLALYAFDGTGTDYSAGSNIRILYDIYDGRRFYYAGVGSSVGTKAIGGLTGFGGRGILEAAYMDFIRAVQAGDGYVDIIGFSRGASMAREFANMIHSRGYRESAGSFSTQTRGGRRRVIFQSEARGKKPDDCTIIIRFVGMFDTVGSFGVPGNGTNIGYNLNLPPSVQNAAHATSQDEQRFLFPLTPLIPAGPGQNFSEQSFPGDHSDIGRGHRGDTNDLSRAPLQYIWSQGRAAGVPFGPLPPYTPTGNTTPHNLNTGVMSLWGILPTRPR